MGYKNRFANISARKKMGISQEDYIPYLWGVARSTLAVHENRKRDLPFAASMRNLAIEVAFARPETAETTEARLQQQKLTAVPLLAARHKYCLEQIERIQCQLAKMQRQYQQCLDLARVAATAPAILAEIFPNNNRSAEDISCLESFGRSAGYKMEKCGIAQQQLLQLKIEALQFEAGKIDELLKK